MHSPYARSWRLSSAIIIFWIIPCVLRPSTSSLLAKCLGALGHIERGRIGLAVLGVFFLLALAPFVEAFAEIAGIADPRNRLGKRLFLQLEAVAIEPLRAAIPDRLGDLGDAIGLVVVEQAHGNRFLRLTTASTRRRLATGDRRLRGR